MKTAVDAFGGDNAPLEVLKGAVMARDELKADIVLCGNKKKITECAEENSVDISDIEILDAENEISMEDNPASAMRSKKNSSMSVAFKALNDGMCDAFVSGGNTGAVAVGGMHFVKRIKGVRRPAIASVMPSAGKPFMLIDIGANVQCKPEDLLCFGIMGSVYMSKIMNVSNPRVSIANIGTEKSKGTELQKETFSLLENSSLNFIGNTEVRDIPSGVSDVIVSDGFTGNVILKMYEGTAKFFSDNIKQILTKNPLTLFGALFVKDGFANLSKKMDYKEFGGAPIMGLRKPVIKAHGSSDAYAFKNAIRQAVSFSENDINGNIENKLSEYLD